jgi:hypothetical protein
VRQVSGSERGCKLRSKIGDGSKVIDEAMALSLIVA